ncbi:nascent polypeptide-associated complex protein [Methanoplanus limicola]|jgi:nascent polypeptide-associated complex subunit alpha|uniref:Nascent polypeptide-associated complex protein n=1 Tax=Methanoplanus limicola DSM 2279 TaxID=937775 RepID=H1Z2C2_9EURY|nr:nascent polypeptide-associated complex protein [Methanoplanus limicola]EHQ34651.1 Nascent polypeptide associated complex NAC [Methanoplanus limicola DSM 2279]
MIPGVNPRQMKAMMKKLGMKSEDIEGVEKVVIYTKSGNYVFDNAEIVATTMQGMTTYQINGEPRFEEGEAEIPDEDIALVSEQAQVSREEAKEALKAAGGDIAEAIIKLSE